MKLQVFNGKSRTSNSIKISAIGGITNIIKILLGFGYRTVFVLILSEVYLGINGLFTNILTILSLAELGITTAIVYRFYEPISRDDVHYVGMLMNFFRRVYAIIALIITGIGLALLPFIKSLVNNPEEIPSDVNIYVVYLLFLAASVSSYIFAYKLTLLTADQKNYIFSVIDLIITISKYGLQILVLILTKNYTITLAAGIGIVLVINFVSSIWTTRQYKAVFEVKEMLPREERKKILTDTKACMYHKVGTVVIAGTDNAILTKMVSLAATGIYSNYSMVISYINIFMAQILGNFTASVGNAVQEMDGENYFRLFKKIHFVGLWAASVVSVCVYAAIDDLICVWLGESYILGGLTTIIICIYMYLMISRTTNAAFINAGGLFVKDKIRPLIEAVLNLGISIVLTYYMGISGVFLGTIISSMLTAWWREPYIIFKYGLKRSVGVYWVMYGKFTFVIIFLSALVFALKKFLIVFPLHWGTLILEVLVVFALVNFVLWVLFRKMEEYVYLKELAIRVLNKLARRKK